MNACERFARFDLIFVGKYKDVSATTQIEDKMLSEKYSTFEVTEMFLGAEDDVRKVIYNSTGMSHLKLIDGELYLIYARKNNRNTFNTGRCSTLLLKDAGKDLEFLRNIPKHLLDGSALSGLVETSRDVDIKDIKIKVEKVDDDSQTIELPLDTEEKFELFNLAKGKYKVTPFYLGQSVRNLYSSAEAFEIRGSGCYGVELFLGKDKDGIFNF